MAKDYYHDLLLPEIIRYAKIRSMNPETLDEDGASVFATWFTQNPLGRPGRDSICNFEDEPEPVILDRKSMKKACGDLRLGEENPNPPKPKRTPRKKKGVLFTAHTHPSEPLEPSPDDLLIYRRLDRRQEKKPDSSSEPPIIHFIIDGFLCRKADKNQK